MKTKYYILALICVCLTSTTLAQTSWKGTSSTAWSLASNWTNGVPTATVDAILGDASFTGPNQPTVDLGASCKSLTLGGTNAVTLTITKNLTVSGNVLINSNATISQAKVSLSLTGNWTNNGTYTTTNTGASVIFSGVTQSITGAASTSFKKLTVNASSTVTLAINTTCTTLTVSGILNPGSSTTYLLTATSITVSSVGRLLVYASLFSSNYSVTPALSAGSIVEYASATTNQTVSNSLTYSTLTISGNTIKTLAGNLPSLVSTVSTAGNVYVNAGTLDLLGFTANRGTTVVGGTFRVSNAATLKIAGTNTFPANYSTKDLQLTSTVQYCGTNQTILAVTYGHLIFSSSSGAAVKTMPASAFTIEGDFSSVLNTGTSVTYTAASIITVNGNVSIGTGTSFNAGSFSHLFAGDLTTNGTLTGSTSTINFTGANSVINGSGTISFNNLSILASNVTAASTTNFSVGGNLLTTGSGQFTHLSGGTITMSGASKIISGSDIVFSNLTISGTITTAASFIITGNFISSGSFTASSGSVTMNGASKTISGAGTIVFYMFIPSGTINTSTSFNISNTLDVSGTFSASAGTATFTSTSSLNGTANLYNVTINGTSLTLSSGSVLGIANTFTITTGSLNVTSNIPNTVNFNGTGAQSVNAITYHHLVLSNGNTKTALGAVILNGDFTIAASTTFNASTYSHQFYGNWTNSGIFTAGSSTVELKGTASTTVTGTTTFNILTVNKSVASNTVTLNNNISVPALNMTSGTLLTGSNTVTITTTRTGNGIIFGTITRTHTFSTGTAYAFEGPDNTINFSAVSGVTSITVNVSSTNVADFPNGESINRVYDISIPSGTYTGTLRLHYEDAELNGNNESFIQLWKYNGTAWGIVGKTANNTTSNYVEQNSITNLTNRWTCNYGSNIVKWNGSVSSNWNDAANWTAVSGTPGTPPLSTDIVQIGTSSFTSQPTISSAVTVKSIVFGSAQAATLTIASGGSLSTTGNISGSWSANANHSINAGNQNLTVNGDLILSDGTTNHNIALSVGTGSVTVIGSFTQSGNAPVLFTGSGSISIGKDFNYSSGTFTSGSGTVIYNGTTNQLAAPIAYNHVTINKTAGTVNMNSSTTVAGNLLVTSGNLNLNADLAITGNATMNSGTSITGNATTISLGGNWNNSGTFITGTSTLLINGTSAQTISASAFNNLVINKSAGTASASGNLNINNNLTITSGTLDLLTYTANRTASGGVFTASSGTSLLLAGSNNFPANYATYTLAQTSTVHYNGIIAQTISGTTYGNLTISNGTTNAKTFAAAAIINGDITINSNSTLHSGGYTLNLYGNWTNNGTFTASTGTIVLSGTSKNISGNTTFNHVTVNGSYTVTGSDIIYNGLFNVSSGGTYSAGSGLSTVNGDLTNNGSLTSTGTTTFSGTTVQTIRLINALVSTSTGVVNFNGTVSPVLNSTTSPSFATLNINNTAGINASTSWIIYVAMNISSGGIFNGGASNHTIYGSFSNAGTFTSSGTIYYTGASSKTINFGSTGFSSSGTIDFSGSGQITISGTPVSLNHVTISNTHTAGVTPASNWNMAGNFSISSVSIFNASTYSYSIAGNIESNGTLNGGSSTFTMSSATGELSGSANTTFNHFVISGSVVSLSDFHVAGNYTNNGTYDGTQATMIMDGGASASIGGTTTPSTLAQLIIAKTGAAVVTMNVNLSAVSLLYIQSGTLFTSTYSVTQDASGGFLVIDDNATFRLGGTNSLPGFSGYSLSANSNVDYAGTTQSIANAATYGNLIISAAGTKNAIVPFVTQGNFTLSNGTFTSAISVTHTIGGNWNMSSGTFTNTNITIVMNGTSNQDINSTGAFKNLTINKASGLTTLSSAVTVSTTLNLTSGKISIGNNDLTIGNSGSITNASASNYIVATGTGTLKQQVVAGGSKSFPVGTSTAYTPASITLTGGSTTDIFNVRMFPAFYSGGTTGSIINSNTLSCSWMIAETVNGGSDATVSLQWPASIELPGFNRTLSRVAHYTAGSWDYGLTDINATGTNPYTVTRSGFTSFSPFAVSMYMAVLPVLWIDVNGRNEQENNYINWSLTSDIQTVYFSVEASTDGNNFSEAGKIKPDVQDHGKALKYYFIHNDIKGKSFYYRVKQVDIDSNIIYSKIIRIVPTPIGGMKIYPNPVKTNTTFSFNLSSSSVVSFVITDINGEKMYSYQSRFIKGCNCFQMDMSSYSPGIYLLTMCDETGTKKTIQIFKTRDQ
jgi:fibronectin-binding autotransporter adhesin